MPTPKVELKITARDETRAAIQSVKQGLGSISGQLASLQSGALKITAAFATLRFAVAPLVNFGRAAVTAADDLLALSERTGISVEKLSLLAHAARAANTDIETVATGAGKLSLQMLKAARDSKSASAQLLGAFGVTEADSLEGALEKVLTQLAALPPGWQKSSLAAKIFGNAAGGALIPFANGLKDGLKQARRFNVGISTETATAADAFNESLAAIKASLSSSFVTALTPVLNDLTRTLNDPKVQSGLRNLAATVAGAASAIVSNFDIIKTAFAALAAVAVAMLAGRVVGALQTWITTTKAAIVAANAQRAVTLAGLQATLQQTAVEKARAVALAASAQAAAANAVGSARMNAVLNSVLPAQRAAAAATATHTAAQVGMAGAMGVTARVATGLRGVLAFLGGPIGAITTALSLGVTAWLLWGNTAEAAGRQASAAVTKADQLIEQFTESTKLAAAGGSQITAALKDLDRDAARLTTKLEVLRRFQAQVAKESGGRFQNSKVEVDIKDALADIEAVRSKTAALQKLQAKGAETPTDFSALLGKLGKSGGKGAAGVAAGVRQSIESGIALMQDALAREQRLLDQQLEDQLISFREFYRKKTELAQSGIDAEIEAKRRELALAKDQGDVAKLTSEITLLERKRGDVAVEARREQIKAEQQLNDEIARTRGELAQLKGNPLQATEIRVSLEQRDLRSELEAEINDPGNPIEVRVHARVALQNLDEIKKLTIAQGGLADLEEQISGISELAGARERSLELNITGGLETEISGRQKIVKLHQETAAQLERLIPAYAQLAAVIGTDEAQAQVEGLRNRIAELKQPVNELAQSVGGALQSSFGDAFADLISGAKSVGEAFNSLVSSLLDAFSRIAAEQIAQQLFGGIGRGGQGVGLFAQLGDFLASFFHQGGVVGAGGVLRAVHPLAFASAPRLHSGGVLGLRSNEVPAILERGEEVLTRGDRRNARNGGGAVNVTMNISTPDAQSFRRARSQIEADMKIMTERGRRNL